VGGKLRVMIRHSLTLRQKEGVIKGFVPGENWARGNPATEWALEECPNLDDDPDLDMGNRGVTVVVM